MTTPRLVIFSIILDGAPFTSWMLPVLNQLSIPWRWIIAEGTAANVKCTSWCKPQTPRLSRDGTSEFLSSLQSHPNITVIRKQQWAGKVEQCNACLALIESPCTLLQMDIDEIWTAAQLERLVKLFEGSDPGTCADFFCRYFVGWNIVVTPNNDLQNNRWRRAWHFTPRMRLKAHEPPTMEGIAPYIITREETQRAGLVFDHYSYVTVQQVAFKETFYGYTNAVKHWQRLQVNKHFPVKLKSFFPWSSDGAIADLLYK